MKPASQGAPTGNDPPTAVKHASIGRGKIMLIGDDRNQVLEKRFHAAGFGVLSARSRESALEIARHQAIDGALILRPDSLLNVAEIIFNLKDLCPAAKIIVLLQRGAKTSRGFIRQMLDHRIAGSEIMTRRELQKRLREPHFLSRPPASR